MNRPDAADRHRLREISAAHGILRKIFARSSFEGDEFERAVRFAKQQGAAEVDAPAQVIRCLARWYEDGNPNVAWRVLDAGAFAGGFLWLQASFDRIVAGLKGGRPAVLFVTGIREAVRPRGKRWSPSAETERIQYLQLLEQRIQQWSRRTSTPVSLFVS